MNNSQNSTRGILSNTSLNFLGQVVPLLLSVATIPLVARGLGVQALGVLSFCWVLLGYFSFFDFGLGRATTRFVAEAAGSGDTERIRDVFWASLSLQGLLGCFAGAGLALATPVVVRSLPGIALPVRLEATMSLYLISAAIPLLLISSVMRGGVEGVQRFDLANMGRVFSGMVNAGLPFVGILLGLRLAGIVALQLLAVFVATFVYGLLLFRALPSLRKWRGNFEISGLRKLLSYGGWIVVINVVSPVLTYFDRILLGTVVSVSALAYYYAPYSMISKLWIIPSSFFVTLFPLFSVVSSKEKQSTEVTRLLALTSKYLVLVTGPIALVFTLFGGEVLTFWLGKDFATQGTRALQILSIGFLLNSISWGPSTMLQGVGRPDLVAKVFLLETPFYIVAAWWLIRHLGINGAAFAWMLRSVGDLVLLYGAALRSGWIRRDAFPLGDGVSGGTVLLLGTVVAMAVLNSLIQSGIYVRFAEMGVVMSLFGLLAWVFILDDEEKGSLKAILLRAKPDQGCWVL